MAIIELVDRDETAKGFRDFERDAAKEKLESKASA
jgi:hypothetical protein